MKRFIAGLTFALTLTATAHAQEYQTVSQLRESVPARWTTKVETKWRDVDIDAEIVTPDVETICACRHCDSWCYYDNYRSGGQ